MVKELYPSLGFDAIDGVETAQWVLNVEKYQNRECYIEKK